jgi:hypothetical protein
LRGFLQLRPGITQLDGPIQNQQVLCCGRVNAEITEAFKLETIKWFQGCNRRFDLAVTENFQGLRVEEFFEVD